MKKKIPFILLISFSLSIQLEAQIVAEDAKGQTSVLYGPSAISLDIGEAALGASVNNFRKLAIGRNTYIWGLGVKGKNAEGLADLWNSGNITAESQLTGNIGYRWYPVSSQEQRIKDSLSRIDASFITRLNDSAKIEKRLENDVDVSGLSDKDKQWIKDTLLAIREAAGYDLGAAASAIQNLVANMPASPLRPGAAALLTQLFNNVQAFNNSTYADLHQAADSVADLQIYLLRRLIRARKQHSRQSILLYFSGGMNASTFSSYDTSRLVAFDKKFPDVKYRGGFADISINYSRGKHWIWGLSIGYEKANTFDSLSKKDYTLAQKDTSGSQVLTTDKKYTAYSGFYQVYDRFNIKTDAVFFAKLGDSARCVWNVLYTRWQLPLHEKNIKAVVKAGTAINIYKKDGRLMGGVYLEQNDAFNKVSGEESSFWKRLSFGVVAKYAFSSILSRDQE